MASTSTTKLKQRLGLDSGGDHLYILRRWLRNVVWQQTWAWLFSLTYYYEISNLKHLIQPFTIFSVRLTQKCFPPPPSAVQATLPNMADKTNGANFKGYTNLAKFDEESAQICNEIIKSLPRYVQARKSGESFAKSFQKGIKTRKT